MINYRLHPKPQQIKYFEDRLLMGSFSSVIDEDFDQRVHDLLNDILKTKQVLQKTKGIEVKLIKDESIDKGYRLKVDGQGICISAKNSENIIYGLYTLKQILQQSGDGIQSLDIIDYPTFKYRGIIEGYYGIPWSFDARARLMRFGASLKNNVFIYAPKDDPYHRENWKELYPEDKLAELAALAKLGQKVNNRFVWTLAPFYEQSITDKNFQSAMEKILAKFDQVYAAGVRQFGILGDDVGTLDPKIPVKMMKRLSEWKADKGDVHDLFYCPASYTLTFFYDKEELNAYELGFPEDVHLFHTGRAVCSPIKKEDIEAYRNQDLPESYKGTDKKRRPAMFWLNWPVNDIDPHYRKLHLGPASMLDTELEDLVGLVTNPMQEAHASLFAISGVSDYAWNPKAFDPDENWAWTIENLLGPIAESFKKVASHMANQDDKGIKGLAESQDLQALLDKIKLDDKTALKKIRKKCKGLIKSTKTLLNYEYDPLLKSDLEPYLRNFQDKLLAIVALIDALLYYGAADKVYGYRFYQEAKEKLRDSYRYLIYVDPSRTRRLHAESATKYINPFIKKLEKKADQLYKGDALGAEKKLFYSGYDGSNFYRIPLLFKTMDGTELAVADRRNELLDDWGNIDIVLRRKEAGKDFSDPVKVIDLQEQTGDKLAAFSIDASILQDKKTKRIFLFTTVYPRGRGFLETAKGSGYIEKDGEKHLLLFDKEGRKFYVEDGQVHCDNGKKTAFWIVTQVQQPFKQYGDVYQGDMLVGNILYGRGPFKMTKTSYLFSVYSDDDGKTWSGLKDLNPQIKTEDMHFLGVSPSKGASLDSGRLVFPAYYTNKHGKQDACFILSDDHGESWRMGGSINQKRLVDNKLISDQDNYDLVYQAGESSLVVHENGDLRLIIRNISAGLPRNLLTAISKDQGETIIQPVKEMPFKSQSWCESGSLAFSYQDKEYLLISQPSSYGDWLRLDGKLYLLEVLGDDLKLVAEKSIDRFSFAYSSLIYLGDGRIAIFYERGQDVMGQSPDLVYRSFDMSYLLNNEEKKMTEYTIYPLPQSIDYQDQLLSYSALTCQLKGADEFVEAKMASILEAFSSGDSKNKIKIKLEIEENPEEKRYDYYEIKVTDQIEIRAISQDAGYYALLTLEQVLQQAEGFIRKFELIDYANQKIRGVIEGYYGIPWGNKKRKDIMAFSARFKSNVFIFAPKDDPYHREKWRELYPQDQLAAIGELAKFGQSVKNRYVWTISPFKKDASPINEDNVSESIELLLKKFDQLYDVGVRQFGVLGDDVGALPKDVVVQVMHAVSNWGREKQNVYDFVFVPEGYVLADWGFQPDELDQYSAEFPSDILIMFTGESTCAPVTQKAVDGFKHYKTSLEERRDPLFWLNWPVNDIDRTTYRRLFMGKASMLKPGVRNLVGTVTNPLEEAYASYPAIFQVLDYAWNTDDFDANSSWRASFKAIDPDYADALYEIAKHMSNADNGGIEGLEESEVIGKLHLDLVDSIKYDNHEKRYYLLELKEAYEKILQAVEIFYSKSHFEGLKEEMKPYAENLKNKSLAALIYIDAIWKKDIENLDYRNQLEEAETLLNRAKSHKVFTRTLEFPAKELMAESGMKNIDKNINFMKDYSGL